MVKLKSVYLALLLPFIAGCAVHQPIPSDALIKLPQKTIVHLHQQLTPLTPVNPQLAQEQQAIETSIIHKTPTPIWIPPVITKVLILPYVDKKGALHSYQNVFMKLTQGKWLIGHYLMKDNGQVRMLNPLTAINSSRQTYIQAPATTTTKPQANNTTGKGFFEGGKVASRTQQPITSSSSEPRSEAVMHNAISSMEQQ